MGRVKIVKRTSGKATHEGVCVWMSGAERESEQAAGDETRTATRQRENTLIPQNQHRLPDHKLQSRGTRSVGSRRKTVRRNGIRQA